MSDVAAGFHSWGIVEVMGHKTYAGEISEQVVAGQAFVRIDVPEVRGIAAYTKLIGTGSVYGITPTDEQVARIAAMKLVERPVSPYIVPVEYQIAAQVDGDLALDADKVAEARAWADQIRDELGGPDDDEEELDERWDSLTEEAKAYLADDDEFDPEEDDSDEDYAPLPDGPSDMDFEVGP